MIRNLILGVSFLLVTLISFSQPVITQNPVGATLCPDSCKTFTVQAVGDGLIFDWQVQLNGTFTSIGDSTTAINLCSNIASEDSVLLRCVVIDSNNLTDTSTTVTIELSECQPPVANFDFQVFGDSVCFTDLSLRAETVLWNFGNGSQSSLRNPCNDYNDEQIYYVSLYVFNDYGTDIIEKEISTVGIGETLDEKLNVFPNPFADHIGINGLQDVERILLINASGQVLNSFNPSSSSFQLQTSELPAGMYFIQVKTSETVISRKLFKN